MIKLKTIFYPILISPFFSFAGNAAVSSECMSYTDCDELVACELYSQVENAINGLAADYNGAVANAASYRTTCSNYPDLFAKNIDTVIYNNPEIRLTINWDIVRKRMRYGSQGDFSNADQEILSIIVYNILGPDTEAQRVFFVDLVTAYINANKADPTARLDNAFILDFLGNDDNLYKYKSALIALSGEVVDENYGININWDEVLIEISQVLDSTMQKRGAILCENNRSWQMTIDIVGWGATAAATILTFFAGGAGGAAVTAGRAAIGAGLKSTAKGIAKLGATNTARSMTRTGSHLLARSAIDLSMASSVSAAARLGGKGVLKTGVKNYTKIIKKNLASKATKFFDGGALVYLIGSNAAKHAGSTLYSLVNSDLSNDIINCQDVDHNEGCYTVCGDGLANDDINTKVFKPILGKTYCVNEEDYVLYEINPDGSRGNVLIMDTQQWEKVKNAIISSVKDQGKCDWNEDDIDMYAGFYMYDPDTLEISTENMVVDDTIRIDD